MALDPNIALGVRGIELPNQLAQYAQVAQIQQAQQTQQMNALRMQEYQQEVEHNNALRQSPAPEGINAEHWKINPTKALALAKSVAETKNLSSTGKHLDAQTQDLTIKALGNTFDNFTKLNPPTTAAASPQGVAAYITNLYADPLLGAVAAKQMPLEAAIKINTEGWSKDPNAWIAAHSGLTGEKLFDTLKGTRQNTSLGGVNRGETIDVYGRVVPGSAVNTPMTKTFADINAASRLALEREKFNFEQRNPGFELKENENGEFFGVNKRTLQAFPVTIGGGATSAAAPMVQGAGGMPGPRVAQPSGVVPAIPGMTSVLDQNMPAAAPAAGGPRQLVGKGTAMTESQSKSAMFGAAMNQANGIISKVEKDGTTTAPVAVSVLQGLAKLSPQFLGSGENAANAIESIFRQDPTSLLGPDVNQQKLGQAQIAFATAYLRATSGASFGPSEVSNTIKEYFPLVGEDKTVVQQKAKARQRAIEGMKISTSKQGQNYIDKSGANANDPLELFGGKP
jgi:hypothetical protein